MKTIKISYIPVEVCPLCCSVGVDRAELSRPYYFFGTLNISPPEAGVFLRECTNCSLLYKSDVPDRTDLAKIMSKAATGVWRQKSGLHPAVAWIMPYLGEQPKSILDIGASNGDLLAQLKPYASCISALDVVAYPHCRSIVDKEYIIGEIEGNLVWSGEKYDLVTAFDIFEHFLDAGAALNNISSMVQKSGRLIVETGDWTCYKGDLGDWYYANLFEHQIFWNQRAFNYLCDKYAFNLLEYKHVVHKNRREIGFIKRWAMESVVTLAKFTIFQRAMLATGNGNPLRFGSPSQLDHAFVVLEKTS